MATAISTLITNARRHLQETTASFWSDAELLEIATRGITDLWGAVLNLKEEYFLTIDVTNVSLAADATTLTGVPSDTFKVTLIEPRDTTDTSATRNIVFVPRDYNDPDFVAARAMGSLDPSSGLIIYYALVSSAAPVAAPTVVVAPKSTSAITLRFAYIPTLGVASYTTSSNNPIAGESDPALINWIVAYAKAKEREDGQPDPGWLTYYATDKQNLLSRLVPRQEQEPDHARAVFEAIW